MKRLRKGAPTAPHGGAVPIHLLSKNVFDLIARFLDWRSTLAFASACRATRSAGASAVDRLASTLFGCGAAVGCAPELSLWTHASQCSKAQRRGAHITPVCHKLEKESADVRSVCWSGDGERLLVGYFQSTGWASYAAPTGPDTGVLRLVQRYEQAPGKRSINVACLLAHNSYLVVSGTSKPVAAAALFDERTGSLVQTYTQHADTVFSLATTPSLLVSGGGQTDCNAFVMDLETAALLHTLPCKGSVRGLHVEEQVITTASLDGYVRVWDARASSVKEQSAHKVAPGATCHAVHRQGDTVLVTTGRPLNAVYTLSLAASHGNASVFAQHTNGVGAMHVNAMNVVAVDYSAVVSVTPRDRGGVCTFHKPAASRQVHTLAVAPRVILHAGDRGCVSGHWFDHSL